MAIIVLDASVSSFFTSWKERHMKVIWGLCSSVLSNQYKTGFLNDMLNLCCQTGQV